MQNELDIISRDTLAHYNERAEDFWAGTRDHDVTQNRTALLTAIAAGLPDSDTGTPPTVKQGATRYRLLDFGCGPGRDLRAFAELGHDAIGLEGAARFAQMAREYSGCKVWQQDFLNLDLPKQHFDGVFANASLFHVPSRALPQVLLQLQATLRPGGVLFSSNPRGDNSEGWNRGRYGAYHDFTSWSAYVSAAGFTAVDHYYRPPGLPRDQQPWLATLWRKPAA